MVCPHCLGTGNAQHLPIQCQWCRGIKRVSPARAEHYANHVEMLGCSGYICGDHNQQDMREMVAEATAIRANAKNARNAGDNP